MAAHLNLEKDLTVLATAGRVVIVGSRGSLNFTPRLAMVKEATILGLALWNATRRKRPTPSLGWRHACAKAPWSRSSATRCRCVRLPQPTAAYWSRGPEESSY